MPIYGGLDKKSPQFDIFAYNRFTENTISIIIQHLKKQQNLIGQCPFSIDDAKKRLYNNCIDKSIFLI